MNDFINSTVNTKFYNEMQDEHQIISIIDKEVVIKNIGTIVSGDTNSCLLSFEINRFQDGMDLSDKKIKFIYKNRLGTFPDEAVNVKYNDEVLRFSWLLPYSFTKNGKISIVSIEIYGVNEYDEDYSFKTKNFKLNIEDSLDLTDTADDTPSNWTVTIENEIESINKRVDVLNESNFLESPDTAKVGQIFRVQSIDEDGKIVLEAIDMLGSAVSDVHVDGNSIVGEDGTADIPIADQFKKYGLFKYGDGGGLLVQTAGALLGCLAVQSATSKQIKEISSAWQTNFAPVVASQVAESAFYGLSKASGDETQSASNNPVGQYTDEAKASIWNMLTSIKTVMDDVAVAGAHYILGEMTEVSVVLPDDALIGQEVTVTWYNGYTASTLSITGNMLDFNYTPEANTRSEINCQWDGRYWSVIGLSQDVPSEEVASE